MTSARNGEPVHERDECRVPRDERFWDVSRSDEFARSVGVGEERVEGAHPLCEASVEEVPLVGVNQAGDDVEGDEPVGVTAIRIDGKRDSGPSENER
jgi:hypothetical protein